MNDNYGIVPPTSCPNCGEPNDCATCPEDESAAPSPGDWTVCMRCGVALVFDAALRTVWPDPNDEPPPELEKIRATVHAYRRKP